MRFDISHYTYAHVFHMPSVRSIDTYDLRICEIARLASLFSNTYPRFTGRERSTKLCHGTLHCNAVAMIFVVISFLTPPLCPTGRRHPGLLASTPSHFGRRQRITQQAHLVEPLSCVAWAITVYARTQSVISTCSPESENDGACATCATCNMFSKSSVSRDCGWSCISTHSQLFPSDHALEDGCDTWKS